MSKSLRDVKAFDTYTLEPTTIRVHVGNICKTCGVARSSSTHVHTEVQRRPDICNACVEKRDGKRLVPGRPG